MSERRGREMESDAARNAREALELAHQMSSLLDTGLDRHTLSLLIALCDRGVNPECLAALVREFSLPQPPAPSGTGASASSVATLAASPVAARGLPLSRFSPQR